MFKEIFLSDEQFFELSIGKRVLKKDILKSKGKIPLYSSNVFHPFGYVAQSNINYFTGNHILWGIDGNFDFNIKKRGEPFATTDHCGVIKIKQDNILPEYLLYQLNLVKHMYGFDRSLRASLNNMRNIKIKIPYKNNGKIDVKKQEELVAKYMKFLNIKNEIKNLIEEIEGWFVELNTEESYKLIMLEDIFDIPPVNSGITKTFCKKNRGKIPVYGSSKNNIPLGYIKDNLPNIKYYENCIGYNRNGSVGYFFYREERFTTNEDHRVLILKNKYKNRILYEYMKYILEIIIRKLGFNFSNKLGKERIRSIYIPIPVDDNGRFDIEKQREIAKKYEIIMEIKQEIIDYLTEIAKVEIDFE